MKVYNMEQQTEEWFAVRRGKMSASHATAIGANGKGLQTYILEMMSEAYSSAEKEHYSNADTERGNELEGDARELYELETGSVVKGVGFVELDDYSGCSPDGLIGDDGLVEIKCPNDKNYFKFLLDGKVDSKYIWQVQMQMLVTKTEWCDLVYFNPNFKPSIKITKVRLDPVAQEKLMIGLGAGRLMIKSMQDKFKSVTQ